MSALVQYRKLFDLEARMLELPQVECPLRHYFAEGLYVREISIPADTLLVGYTHKRDCITTVSKGKIVISDGAEVRTFEAPCTICCPAGSKKAGYTLEDTVWSDAYANEDNETDLDKLAAKLVEIIDPKLALEECVS